MLARSVVFATGEFYHIYNRGTDKRILFYDLSDYERFLELLYLVNNSRSVDIRNLKRNNKSVFSYVNEPIVSIGAYCLMPNHFHLLATPLVESGVSKFMSKLMTGYSMYFNKKYKRIGTLYEGPFKAKHVNYDQYLKYMFAYIHLNPIKLMSEIDATNTKEKTVNFLQNYRYSSFPDYIGKEREETLIINPQLFPDYFTTASDHIDELKIWLKFKPEDL